MDLGNEPLKTIRRILDVVESTPNRKRRIEASWISDNLSTTYFSRALLSHSVHGLRVEVTHTETIILSQDETISYTTKRRIKYVDSEVEIADNTVIVRFYRELKSSKPVYLFIPVDCYRFEVSSQRF